jgi:hypothetical protein
MTLIGIAYRGFTRMIADQEIAKIAGLPPIKPNRSCRERQMPRTAEMTPDLARLSAFISAHLRQFSLRASAPPR